MDNEQHVAVLAEAAGIKREKKGKKKRGGKKVKKVVDIGGGIC